MLEAPDGARCAHQRRGDAADALRAKLVTPLGFGGGYAARGDCSPMGWASATSPSRSFSPAGGRARSVRNGCIDELASRPTNVGEGVLALGGSRVPHLRALGRCGAPPGLRRSPIARTAAGDARRGCRRLEPHKLLGVDATPGQGLVAALARTRDRWRAVHFACHGFVDPEAPAALGRSRSLRRRRRRTPHLRLTSTRMPRSPPTSSCSRPARRVGASSYKAEGIVGLDARVHGGRRAACPLLALEGRRRRHPRPP